MTDDHNTHEWRPRKAPMVSVMVHLDETSRIRGDTNELGFFVNMDGDGRGGLTIFFPDILTVEVLRDVLNARLDEPGA